MTIYLISESGLSVKVPTFIVKSSMTIRDLTEYAHPEPISNLRIKTRFSHRHIKLLTLNKHNANTAIGVYPILDYLACIDLLVILGSIILSTTKNIPRHVLAIMADIPELGVDCVMRGLTSYTTIIRPNKPISINRDVLEDYVIRINNTYQIVDSMIHMRISPQDYMVFVVNLFYRSSIEDLAHYMLDINYDEGLISLIGHLPILISILYKRIIRSGSTKMISYIFDNRVCSELEYISPENWLLESLSNKSDYSLRLLQLELIRVDKIKVDDMIDHCRNNNPMMNHLQYIVNRNNRQLTAMFCVAMLITGRYNEANILINRYINTEDIVRHIGIHQLSTQLLNNYSIDVDTTIQCVILMKNTNLMYHCYLDMLLNDDSVRTWHIITELLRMESEVVMLELLKSASISYMDMNELELIRYYAIWFVKVLVSIMPNSSDMDSIIRQFPYPIYRSLQR